MRRNVEAQVTLQGMRDVDEISVGRYDGYQARSLAAELCEVYADAYDVATVAEKTIAFRNRADKAFDRPGFSLVTARSEGRLVGFAFGSPLPSGDRCWWTGLQPQPSDRFIIEAGHRTFVLSEIQVRRALQGRGAGHTLHDALLENRAEERATLATSPKAPTQAIYEHWGWQGVGRVPGGDSDYYSAYDLFVLKLAQR